MNAVPTLRHKYLPIPQLPEMHLFQSRNESSDVPNDRFGSLAVIQTNTSLMSAIGRKAVV